MAVTDIRVGELVRVKGKVDEYEVTVVEEKTGYVVVKNTRPCEGSEEAHETMLAELGECSWCGMLPEDGTYLIVRPADAAQR